MPLPPIVAAAPISTAPALSFLSPTQKIRFFHHHRSFFTRTSTFPFLWNPSRSKTNHGPLSRILVGRPLAMISRHSCDNYPNAANEGKGSTGYDPELRSVLELATDSELYELERILFGPSYFSPLLKSILKSADGDTMMIGEDPDDREDFISRLESRFLFLAADAKSTLRGWRPSYRKVLLAVRKQLKIPCSKDLSAEDLEVEIFLHLLKEYSSEKPRKFSSSNGGSMNAEGPNDLELGLSLWKVQKLAALGIGATELRTTIMKSGGMLTLEKLLELVGGRLSMKMLSEAGKYQMKKEAIDKGGKLAAIHLESAVGMLAAKQGLKTAATRYLGLRSLTQLLGPIMWGTLLADIVIQMLGTDYARILRAIYAFAQIRIYRSYKTAPDIM